MTICARTYAEDRLANKFSLQYEAISYIGSRYIAITALDCDVAPEQRRSNEFKLFQDLKSLKKTAMSFVRPSRVAVLGDSKSLREKL